MSLAGVQKRTTLASTLLALLGAGFVTACNATHRAGSGPSAGHAASSAVAAHGGGAGREEAGTGGSPAGRGAAGREAAGRGAAGTSGQGGAGGGIGVVPLATDIVLENAGSAPIVLGNGCGGLWLTLERDGEPLDYNRYCKSTCDTAAGDRVGCPAICVDSRELVFPGERKLMPWDGLQLVPTNQGCVKEQAPARSSQITARACWNEDMFSGASSGQCASQDFAYGDQRQVVIRVQPAPEAPRTITLVLQNTSGAPIDIVTERCGQQAVFELDSGGKDTLASFCDCGCNANWQRSACPVCGPCAEDEITTLGPSESFKYEWDREFIHRYASGCSARYALPASWGGPAKACWRAAGTTNEICTGFRLDAGSGKEVVVHAQAP